MAVKRASTSYIKGSWSRYLSTSTVTTQATGGTISQYGGYRIHTFISGADLTVTTAGDVECLIVGGGGGGGTWSFGNFQNYRGGGGGGGGLVSLTTTLNDGVYPVIIGAAGAGAIHPSQGLDGGNSLFAGLLSYGGGGGGTEDGNTNGRNGGSGGGAAANDGGALGTPGNGVPGQGNAGIITHGGGAGVAGDGVYPSILNGGEMCSKGGDCDSVLPIGYGHGGGSRQKNTSGTYPPGYPGSAGIVVIRYPI